MRNFSENYFLYPLLRRGKLKKSAPHILWNITDMNGKNIPFLDTLRNFHRSIKSWRNSLYFSLFSHHLGGVIRQNLPLKSKVTAMSLKKYQFGESITHSKRKFAKNCICRKTTYLFTIAKGWMMKTNLAHAWFGIFPS